MVVFLSICAIGFLLLLLSLIFGEIAEHAGDFIHDAAVDHSILDHGGGVEHAAGGPSIFSFRMLAAFATGFGGAGAISTHLGGSLLVSSLAGAALGFAVAALIYAIVSFLYKQQASSGYDEADLVGKAGAVSIAITANGTGEVVLAVKGTPQAQLARSESGAAIAQGASVVVKKVAGTTVIVEPAK